MKNFSQRGSVLLGTLFFSLVLVIAVSAIMDLSLSSYRLSMRNLTRAQGLAVAQSELEYIYFQFENQVMSGTAARDIPAGLTGVDIGLTPATLQTPYLQQHRNEGWQVYRSINYDDPPGEMQGIIPHTTKTGTFAYYTVKVEVKPPASNILHDSIDIRVGRRMNNSSTSIFQYNVFSQGDLEMAPGGNTVINGDIATNGNAYLAAGSGTLAGLASVSLTIGANATLRFPFNKGLNTDPSTGLPTLRKPGTYDPGAYLKAPVFAAAGGQAAQTAQLDAPENLLGGANADQIATDHPELFGIQNSANATVLAQQHADAVNNVYRSLLSPPPNQATAAEYPPGADLTAADDPAISVQRVYNRALTDGIVVTVAADGTASYTGNSSGIDISSAISQKSMFDQREQKTITITEVDVGVLKALLDATPPPPPAPQYPPFNGVLYVNLKNSTSSAPAAVRLVNGAQTPNGAGNGFSVATNGGLYIKGNYNTATIADYDGDGTVDPNPAMVMADAVTLLSDSWSDANSSNPNLASRYANMTAPSVTFQGNTYDHGMIVAAGILTGNVAATTSDASGGAQNLVRYLEDWRGDGTAANPGGQAVFHGSLGMLFNSHYFTAAYQQPGTPANIYRAPGTRTYDFNTSMKVKKPPGSPIITSFSRGDFINIW